MAKRSATSELNHDNWDDKEDVEDAGSFTPLRGSELQNRVIRKAKRSLNASSGTNSLPGTSPFAKFAGFTSSSSTSSPFGSLKKSTDISSPFTAMAKKLEEKANGSSLENEEKSTDKTEDGKKSISTAFGSTAQEKQARSFEYYRQLQSLNESVLKWMQLHLAKNSCCDFTPVFNDYKKHMDTLNVTYPVRKKEVADSKNADALKTSKGAVSNLKSSRNNVSNSSGSSVFRKAKNTKQQDDESNYGAHFSSNTTNTSTFSFGCKLTPTATSSISPSGPTSSSSHEEKKDAPEFSAGFFSKPFQPSSDKPFSFAVASIQKSSEPGESEDLEYVPPKNDFVAVNEEDAFYTKRCKLFFKKGESYAEKGVGTLYLKSLEGKTQLLIRADTSLGNILLNIMLSASLPMSRTGKNNVLLVCIPNPPVDTKNPDSKEAIPILIRVKSAEDADDLLEILNKHKS